MAIMDEDVITLSSDEDCESPKSSETPILKSTEIRVCVSLLKEKLQESLLSIKNMKKLDDQMKLKGIRKEEEHTACPPPEIVDLVDCPDKSPENGYGTDIREGETTKNHSKTNGIDADVSPTHKNSPIKDHLGIRATNAGAVNDKNADLKIETDHEMSINEIPQAKSKSQDDMAVGKDYATEDNCNKISQDTKDQGSNKSLNIFMKFLDHCESLEENPKDREKLIEKLNKYYSGAKPEYVRSKEFRNLIKKCKDKISVNNLYLVAKTITDELKLQKSIENCLKDESATVKEKSQGEGDTNECVSSPRQQKRLAKVQKIIRKLNQLGHTIRGLEKQEVDLSDEEDSVYLKLQRFRERFWTVYKKLCEFTSDLDIRIFDEKIHFTETKYPAINRCIEKWLNKTKSFPDFADILKILESQSAELNLPSDKESLRSIAIEIFQKVGDVLQRKRKYDLWNCLSEFLEDTEDPALKDPELHKIFRENYEIRVKKEQEIYQFYAERQEKESLQPKEVPEDEANNSPESGNEEEEEIINIEKNLGHRLFDGTGVPDQNKQANDDVKQKIANNPLKEKESKNNFKNCKSLKWRSEKGGTSKSESSDNSAAEADVDNGEKAGGADEKEKHSSPELILVEPDNQTDVDTPTVRQLTLPPTCIPSSKKRSLPFGNENVWTKRKSSKKEELSDVVSLKTDLENLNKLPVFDVGYCQIVTNYKFKERRKVFRDLTNLSRLMKRPELRDKMAGLLTPTYLYGRYSLKKETPWKKRFKINLKEVKPKNQKCALNEEEKTGEKISSTSGRDSEDKDSKGNEDDEGQGADFGGQGNGQEGDNNDEGDENRKNGKIEDENDDQEEDDDEEKEDENSEANEHSSIVQKTEKENEDSLEPTSNENHAVSDTEALIVENDETETYAEEDATGEGAEQLNKKEDEEGEDVDGNFENSMDYDDECGRDAETKCKDSEDVEEFENLKNSLEPICVLKEGDASDVIEKANSENPVDVHQKSEVDSIWNEKLKEEKFRTGPFTRSKLRARMGERSKNETQNQKRLPVAGAWTPPSEISQPKPRKMSASDEERVKRFLMHSPSSISITPPKKLTLSKPLSQSALQALATLRNLKGISATIVKGKPKREDGTVLGSQSAGRLTDESGPAAKRRRPDLPVISNVQSVNTLTPKIVTVQGNVSGFESLWPEMRNNGSTESDSSSIRISKVWGSLPRSVVETNSFHRPGCSSRKSNPGTSNQMKKKNPKKQVEYVVLD